LFSSWDKRREYIRMVKADRRRKDLPKLKDKSHLMSFPVQEPESKLIKIIILVFIVSVITKYMRCPFMVFEGFLNNLVFKVYLHLKRF